MHAFHQHNLSDPSEEVNAPAVPKSASRQQRWFRAFLLTLGTVVFLCFALAGPVLRHWRKDEFKDAQPQIGVAVVAMIVMPQANFEGASKQENAGFVNVRFQGHLYKVNKVFSFPQLHPDHPAQIEYRVGKHGDIVVDTVQPLPPGTNKP